MKQFKRLGQGFLFIVMFAFFLSLTSSINAEEWKYIKSEDSVAFYYKISECEKNQVLIIKAVNESNDIIKFKWTSTIKYAGFNDTSDEAVFELESGLTAIGDCKNERLNSLSRFVNIPYSNEKIEVSIEIID